MVYKTPRPATDLMQTHLTPVSKQIFAAVRGVLLRIVACGAIVMATGGATTPGVAQTSSLPGPSALTTAPTTVPALTPAVPGFWDPRRRPDRPDLSRLTVIRFITETDYPPFNFTGPDGNPAGFNVDYARLLCAEIKIPCTIQMRRFETIVDALATNRGDAAIASMAVTPQLRTQVDFTDPYYRAPARFVSLRAAALPEVRPELLEGKKVGVITGSAHEAYLKAFFTGAQLVEYPNEAALRQALQHSEVDLIFGDAISLAFWINGTDSSDCCAFSGGPFTESRYFGEGIGIAVKRGNDVLRQTLNWAMFRVWEKGQYADLWLRYFSINPF
jgi:polar amino acid transport system substrate-binding protein